MRLFAFIFLLSSITANAQLNVQEVVDPSDLEWGEGSILLNDGTELKGLIKYNDRIGVVSFESGSISRSLTPRNISRFGFYDKREEKQRIFYSIINEDSKTNAKVYLFFELVKDLNTFAVLIKTDPISVEQRKISSDRFTTSNGGYIRIGPRYKFWQDQTIYFMDSQGKAVPYMKVTTRKIDTNHPKTKCKLLERDLIKNYVDEPMYSKLENYADENKLDFDEKDDFFKILDYCETLINE